MEQKVSVELEQDNFSVEQDLLYLKSRMTAVLQALERRQNKEVSY